MLGACAVPAGQPPGAGGTFWWQGAFWGQIIWLAPAWGLLGPAWGLLAALLAKCPGREAPSGGKTPFGGKSPGWGLLGALLKALLGALSRPRGP